MTHRILTLAFAIAAAATTVGLSAQQTGAKPDHMQHRFDDPAKFAKSFDDPKRDEWQMPSKVIEALGLKAGMSVADVGAGTGYFSMRLARVSPGLTVFAVDIEPKMIEHLTRRAAAEHLKNVVATLASPTSPLIPRPVDVVLIVDTYHHIGNRVSYFRDLRASLTPGGRIAIVDFKKDSPEGPPVEFRFTAEQIEAEMKLAGFVLAAKHDFLQRQHFLIFK
jgi:cyclopropane fatty-acyl-phospholipid synthase-like methyltransferase